MKIQFQKSIQFPVNSKTIYTAWLNSEIHSKMTGGSAQCSEKEGVIFTAWDGYISGVNVSLRLNSYYPELEDYRI
jgi:hypothetical protein